MGTLWQDYTALTSPAAADDVLIRDVSAGGVKRAALTDLLASAYRRRVYVDDYGADPTGAADSTAAFTAAQAAGGTGPCQLVMSAGTYVIGTSADIGTFGRGQGLEGPGSGLCTIQYKGSGACVAVYDSSFSNSDSRAAPFGGFKVDGSSAGATAAGMSWGNMLAARCHDIDIENFTGASAAGLSLKNGTSAWSEQGNWTGIRLVNCTVHALFDTGSYDYSHYDFTIEAQSGQDGVRLQNGATLAGGFLGIRGNFTAGTGNTGAVIAMDRGDAAGTSQIDMQANVDVEADGSTGTGHFTVLMEGSSSSRFSGTGALVFRTGTATFAGGTFTGTHTFSGRISEPTIGKLASGDAHAFYGGTEWTVHGGFTAALGGTLYQEYGDIHCFQLASGANSFAFFSAALPDVRARRIELYVVQPASGGNGTVTWSGIKWPGGTPPVLSTANGAVDKLRLTYLPAESSWFGELAGAAYA